MESSGQVIKKHLPLAGSTNRRAPLPAAAANHMSWKYVAKEENDHLVTGRR